MTKREPMKYYGTSVNRDRRYVISCEPREARTLPRCVQSLDAQGKDDPVSITGDISELAYAQGAWKNTEKRRAWNM